MKQRIAFALIMGVITTGIISFTLIALNIGLVEKFIGVWLKSWVLSYSIVIPAILLIGPKVQALVEKLFNKKKSHEKSSNNRHWCIIAGRQ